MKPTDVIEHFNTVNRAAEALGVSGAAIYQWLESGSVPELRQSDIEVKTGYLLKSDYTLARLSKQECSPEAK